MSGYKYKYNNIKDLVQNYKTTYMVMDINYPIQINDIDYKEGTYVSSPFYFDFLKKNLKDSVKKSSKKLEIKNNIKNPKKIMIIRGGGIGDIVMTYSVVKKLRKLYPLSTIYYATMSPFIPILELLDIDITPITLPIDLKLFSDMDLHIFFEGVMEDCADSEKYDAYDLFHKRVFFDFKLKDNLIDEGFLPVKFKINYNKNDNNTILIHYRASNQLRSLSIQQVQCIINMLQSKGYKVGIIDSGSEYDFISQTFPTVYNFCSDDLQKNMEIIYNSLGVIAVDSGIAHLSKNLGKKTTIIYTCFSDVLMDKYYRDHVITISPTDCGCDYYPCRSFGDCRFDCPFKSDPKCIKSLDLQQIVDKTIENI